MLLSPGQNRLTSLFKEVRAFKELSCMGYYRKGGEPQKGGYFGFPQGPRAAGKGKKPQGCSNPWVMKFAGRLGC